MTSESVLRIFFFILADNFVISSCCVVTYPNITSCTCTITSTYSDSTRNYSGTCEKAVAKLGNSIQDLGLQK